MKNCTSLFILAAASAALFLGCEAPSSPMEDGAIGAMAAHEDAKAAKADVCHVNGEGLFQKINVSGNAVDAHLGHGDEMAGGDVLDENCQPIPPPATCPCLSPDVVPSRLVDIKTFLLFNASVFSVDGALRLELHSFDDGGDENYGEFEVGGSYCRLSGTTGASIPVFEGVPFDFRFDLTTEQVDVCRTGLEELRIDLLAQWELIKDQR